MESLFDNFGGYYSVVTVNENLEVARFAPSNFWSEYAKTLTDEFTYKWVSNKQKESEPEPHGGIKWGEDLQRDCAEMKRLESWGLYASGHHDQNCSLHD